MKKRIFTGCLCVVALLLAGCSRNLAEVEVPEETNTYTFTLSASLDDAMTKSDYDASGHFSWSAGDKISVLFHNDSGNPVNKFFTLTAVSISGNTATFSGPVTTGYTEGSNLGAKWALFPASDQHVYNTDNVGVAGASHITYHLPGYTDFTAPGAHYSANIPLAANTVTDGKYIFANMCGAYKFTFTDVNVDKVNFTVYNASRAISGDIPAAKNGNTDLAQSSSASGDEQCISFTANVVSKTVCFFIPYRVWTEDFQPMLILQDAATGYTIYSKTAKSAFTDTLGQDTGGRKLVVVPSISAPATPPAPVPDPDFSAYTHIEFTETDTQILNPERGFYKQHSNLFTETAALTSSQVTAYRASGNTLIYLGFYLTDFMEGEISAAYLTKIENSLQALRDGGSKCILRFAYKNGHADPGDKPYDPVKSVVLGHISQLTPILTAYKDVIFVLQCGFVGSWGEWYFTSNLESNADRLDIVNALLTALPAERQIQMRTPGYAMDLYNWAVGDTLTAATAHNGSAHSRLGGHNDCFVASADDSGTFGNKPFDRFFWKGDTRYTIMGGETCAVSAFCACDNTIKDLKDYHWTYLNSGYHTSVTQGWKDNNCWDEIASHLGYRLVLTDVYHTATPEVGQPFKVTLRIENKGYAAPMNPRNAKLVFIPKTGDNTVIDLDVDPRTWHPGGHYFVEKTFNLPSADGTLYLSLPDPLIPADPRYSIGLCSKQGETDIYNAAVGLNKLLVVGNPGDPYASAISIDGGFDDWASVPAVNIVSVSAPAQDYKEFKVAYDYQNLYFYTKRNLARESELPGTSGGYIWYRIDANNDATYETAFYIYPYTKPASVIEFVSNPPSHNISGLTLSCAGRYDSVNSLIELEVSVPRSELGITNGNVLKFQSEMNKVNTGSTLTISSSLTINDN